MADCKLTIDNTSLHETLALVQQIEAAALRAQATLVSLVPTADSAGLHVDVEQLDLILAELQKQTRLLEPDVRMTIAA